MGSSDEQPKLLMLIRAPVVCLDDLARFKRVCKTFNELGSAQQFWHRMATTVYGDVEPVVPPGSRFVKGVRVPNGPVSMPEAMRTQIDRVFISVGFLSSCSCIFFYPCVLFLHHHFLLLLLLLLPLLLFCDE